jgi:hypothetical protein
MPGIVTFYTLHVGIHILIFFLAHLAKGNVGFWHHLASVVCCLSSVNFSHFNLLLKWFQRRILTRIACGGHVC